MRLSDKMHHTAKHCNTLHKPYTRILNPFLIRTFVSTVHPICLLQRVAVCCSVLQCVAVCRSVLQCSFVHAPVPVTPTCDTTWRIHTHVESFFWWVCNSPKEWQENIRIPKISFSKLHSQRNHLDVPIYMQTECVFVFLWFGCLAKLAMHALCVGGVRYKKSIVSNIFIYICILYTICDTHIPESAENRIRRSVSNMHVYNVPCSV